MTKVTFRKLTQNWPEENEFVTHFVQKCLENAQKWAKCGFKWVFGSARKSFGFWYLPWQQLMMAWAEVIMSEKLLLVFRCFTNKMVLFWVNSLKAKQLILVSKIILTDPYVTSRDLHGRKPYKFGVQVSSSRLCSMRALGSTQRNRFTQTSLSKVCSMYWQKYKSQIVWLCSFNNF